MSKGLIINLRKQLKAATARIAALEGQQAQEVLDLAAKHPVVNECLILKSLKALLRKIGAEVKPHDTLHHAITNIVTARDSFREMNRALMSTPASALLKEAIGIIVSHNIAAPEDGVLYCGIKDAAYEFLQKPIVVALMKEMSS